MMKATSTVPIVMAVGVEPVSAGWWQAWRDRAATSRGSPSTWTRPSSRASAWRSSKSWCRRSRASPCSGTPPMARRPPLHGDGGRGSQLGIAVISARVTDPGELERTFTELQRARAQALIVMSDPMTAAAAQRKRIAELAPRTVSLPSTLCGSSSRRGAFLLCHEPGRSVPPRRPLR